MYKLFQEQAICPECGPEPEVIVMDGTHIGFQSKFVTQGLFTIEKRNRDVYDRTWLVNLLVKRSKILTGCSDHLG